MLEASRRSLFYISHMRDPIEEHAKYDYMVRVMEMIETVEGVPDHLKYVKNLRRVDVMMGFTSCQAYVWLMQNVSDAGRLEMNTVVTQNETIVHARLAAMKQAFLEEKAARKAEREAQQQQQALQPEPTAMPVEVAELSQRSTQGPLG